MSSRWWRHGLSISLGDGVKACYALLSRMLTAGGGASTWRKRARRAALSLTPVGGMRILDAATRGKTTFRSAAILSDDCW
jgi:hypothetical protein